MIFRTFLSLSLLLAAAGVAGARTTVVRGPYLQSPTPDSVILRWRTDVAEPSVVRYGLSPENLAHTATSEGRLTEHVVLLPGLKPGTRYYYAFGGTAEKPLLAGAAFTFRTPPAAGARVATRIWALGDPGTKGDDQRRVRDAALRHMAGREPDLVLLLGDNAYPDGTDAEYQAAIFDMYAATFRRTPVWPTLGNHDAHSADSITQSGVYYDIFSLPTRAQAGGVPSGTEAYYSFDHANIHFVCLDSHDTDRSPDGAMMAWLKADLAATRQDWIVAFFHHPTYTKGTHDSDVDKDPRMAEMRANFLPVLEQGGVDLILTGHSHVYERSWLIDGHYGLSTTFDAARHVKQPGNGRADGDGIYRKPAGRAAHAGEVSVVAGSSGQTKVKGALDHPAMVVALAELGSVIFDVDGSRLDLVFVNDQGAKRDWFTLVKE